VRAFVTGGGGFLGGAIVRLLRARGDEVVSYSRAAHPAIEDLGARCVRGDLADRARVEEAMRGSDVVFHVAAKAGIWGKRADYERTNVDGTRTVLDAARANAIARLVYTSSPSVCFDGRDHSNAGNDLPYARAFLAEYPRSKALAEKLVLAANGAGGLATCALRPHLIFGPGDPHLVPRLLERARTGKLAIVGDARNRVSLTYVDNAAHAHLDAADRLAPGAAHAGRAYFVAQEEPVVLWEWIAQLLERLEIAPPKKRLSFTAAYVLGRAAEIAWDTLGRDDDPPMTRFLALQLARTHTYDQAPARRDFGYRERVGLAEATERLVADLRDT
jgi:nucleoside-diphosphate-sugar epimerase